MLCVWLCTKPSIETNCRIRLQLKYQWSNPEKNVEEFKIALSKNVKYKEYLQSNVFDAVLQALAFPEVLLACNLDKKERDEEAALKILEETQFYKEIEYWDRSYRMLRGLW